ncbi:MAG: hypothetical protein K9W44_04725 [Candidatus Lokiarchaeota archaeon]|nr:hypothetical protein [Candidatus Harpocratesius repetitus]
MVGLKISGNTVNGEPLGFFVNTDYDLSIIDGEKTKYGQLILIGCKNVLIRNFDIEDTTLAYTFIYNTNITIENVKARNCLQGMVIIDQLMIGSNQQYLSVQNLGFYNNLVGIHISIQSRSDNSFNIEYKLDFSIQEFFENEYDVRFDMDSFSNHTFTFPVGTKINIDDYIPFEVSIKLNGEQYTETINSSSRFSGSSNYNYSQIDFTLNEEGTYFLKGRTYNNYAGSDEIIYSPFGNLTIIAKKPEFFALDIPGFSVVGIVFWSLNSIGIIIVINTLQQRKVNRK